MNPGLHLLIAVGLGVMSIIGFALSLFTLGYVPAAIPYLLLLGSLLVSIQGVRAARKQQSENAFLYGIGCGITGLLSFGLVSTSIHNYYEAWKNENEVERFCVERGTLKADAPKVSTNSVRFTPNNCYYKFSNELCTAAAYPSMSAPGLLAAGLAFVEFDITKHTFSNQGITDKFVRLHLAARPNPDCYAVDRSINSDEELVRTSLAKMGVPRHSCIAATFGATPTSRHQFVLTSTEDPSEYRKYFFRAELRDTQTNSIVAAVETVQWGGSEKSSAGFSCRNSAEYKKLLDLVVPK